MERIEDETTKRLFFLPVEVRELGRPLVALPDEEETGEDSDAVAVNAARLAEQRQAAQASMQDFTRNVQRRKEREMAELQFAGGDSSASSQPVAKGKKVGRNEPCPCGSGKKYKKCCGAG